ncbi:MAG: zf-HC2 domain-containing protein [Cyanobacteria bacterium NC_groundwater_1444_Ag_S-0.65um_54_12]|nr:zf-HC2 domain-containing protein [Cyanobacteria bacterium NC_groundwater_1444_Ag_S-0.65um_54_12]
MNCQQVEPLLGSYLDGPSELGKVNFAKVEEHLGACRACSTSLDDLRWVIAQLKAQPRIKAPEDLAARLHRRLALEAEPPRENWLVRLQQFINWPSLAVGAVVAAGVMFFVLRGPQPVVGIYASAVPIDQNVAVQIAFEVDEDVQGVTFDIRLQDGLRFVDSRGQPLQTQQVAWRGELRRGKTVVPITVRGIRPGRWEILAVVRKNQLARKTHIIIPVRAQRSGNISVGEG